MLSEFVYSAKREPIYSVVFFLSWFFFNINLFNFFIFQNTLINGVYATEYNYKRWRVIRHINQKLKTIRIQVIKSKLKSKRRHFKNTMKPDNILLDSLKTKTKLMPNKPFNVLVRQSLTSSLLPTTTKTQLTPSIILKEEKLLWQ